MPYPHQSANWRTIVVPVQFLCSHGEFMERVAQVGRMSGLDDDWTPSSLHGAVYEALISATSPDQGGMIIRPASLAGTSGVFTTRVYVDVHEQPDQMILDYIRHLPYGFPANFQNLMLGMLNAQEPPVDLGFEIVDSFIPDPLSAHERIEEVMTVQDCQYRGDPPATMFVA